MYDLIIIGAGPAGITAAVYAARKRIKTLVVSRDIGGQTAISGEIENYTGYQFITGPELTEKFAEHLKKFAIGLKEGEQATGLKKQDSKILVQTDKASYEAKTVIIASGKRSRELGVPGEKEFKNRGLTYCATCDGPLFSAKQVAVVGGGNSGLDAAIQLLRIAQHVYLINLTAQLTGDPIMQEQVLASNKATVYNNTRVTEVFGDKFVKGIRIQGQEKEETLAVEGVFVEVGLLPNSDFVQDVARNEYQEIKVNSRNETNIPGIFAAGDVTDVPEKQIIIAAGEGSKAALSAFRYLVQHKF